MFQTTVHGKSGGTISSAEIIFLYKTETRPSAIQILNVAVVAQGIFRMCLTILQCIHFRF